jgi:hypothetical protein
MSVDSIEEFEEKDLDTSWIEQEEFQSAYEKEPMTEIVLFFIYMNRQMVIENVIKDYIDIVGLDAGLDTGLDGISKEKLLHIIQTRRHRPGFPGKYRFIDLKAFHVPLEPGQLEGFVRGDLDVAGGFMRSLAIFDSVVVDPSIFIFHDLNSLFFFFKEAENPRKSILKSGESDGDHKVTKKVRLDAIDYIDKKRKSLRRLIRRGGTRKRMDS